MPLRTDRGRSAAMRGIWSWPLQSARHLAVAVVVAAVVATGVGFASAAVREPEPAPQAAPAATPGPPPPPPRPARRPTPTTSSKRLTTQVPRSKPPAPPAEVAAALTTARDFTAHWVRPPAGTSAPQWVDGLVPYVIPESVRDLASIDPANIPATWITGDPTATTTRASVIVAAVPTDAGTVEVKVVRQETGGWRVKQWGPA